MGSGSWSEDRYASYCKVTTKVYDKSTKRATGQTYTAKHINEAMKPMGVIRECCNSEEHPNTIPVILALDVTGSMGSACVETAEALSSIMTDLYTRYKDIEFMVMGIGDFECDDAPLQVSQFESDERIARDIDAIYMEHGGGGNRYESYTAAWYFGQYNTKLDAYDKQGRKGIIITMGDEPLNPKLYAHDLKTHMNIQSDKNVETGDLYEIASKKFDIYHIAVDDYQTSYRHYQNEIKNTFGKYLGQRLKVSTIQKLSETITECIDDSIGSQDCLSVTSSANSVTLNENGEISW